MDAVRPRSIDRSARRRHRADPRDQNDNGALTGPRCARRSTWRAPSTTSSSRRRARSRSRPTRSRRRVRRHGRRLRRVREGRGLHRHEPQRAGDPERVACGRPLPAPAAVRYHFASPEDHEPSTWPWLAADHRAGADHLRQDHGDRGVVGDARALFDQRAACAEGVDVVDDFLFRSKVGWCEQVASSLVVMARSVGIPARLATGSCRVPVRGSPVSSSCANATRTRGRRSTSRVSAGSPSTPPPRCRSRATPPPTLVVPDSARPRVRARAPRVALCGVGRRAGPSVPARATPPGRAPAASWAPDRLRALEHIGDRAGRAARRQRHHAGTRRRSPPSGTIASHGWARPSTPTGSRSWARPRPPAVKRTRCYPHSDREGDPVRFHGGRTCTREQRGRTESRN